MAAWVYILSNFRRGVLYTGVTANLPQRLYQHQTGEGSDFCRRYNLRRLVYAEQQPDIRTAIAREKAIKAWKRDWKVRLIEEANPEWRDLSGELHGC
jgi:putative endonuclease